MWLTSLGSGCTSSGNQKPAVPPALTPSGGPALIQAPDVMLTPRFTGLKTELSAGSEPKQRGWAADAAFQASATGQERICGPLGPALIVAQAICTHEHTLTLSNGDIVHGASPNNLGDLEGGAGFALGFC